MVVWLKRFKRIAEIYVQYQLEYILITETFQLFPYQKSICFVVLQAAVDIQL